MIDTEKYLKNKPLLKECIEDLKATILSFEESKIIEKKFNNLFPMTHFYKVDWDKIENKIHIGCDPKYIISSLKRLLNKDDFDQTVYITWSSPGNRTIQTTFDAIVKNFDSVTCVDFEKFIFNPELGYIIEIRTGDDMTIGVIK